MQNTPEASLKTFAKFLIPLEAIILVIYVSFVRPSPVNLTIRDDPLVYERYKGFQDTNVMMLIGFGFLMTFIRTHSLSALSYTFFINAIVMQLYILFSAFWDRVFNGFSNKGQYINVGQNQITMSSYCVASVLIAFGGIIGRVGPKQLLIVAFIQTFAYSLNEIINFQQIVTYDVGGSTTIHTFGAYFGLGASWVLSKKIKPIQKAQSNTISNTFAMIGTLFLWIYWPSFCFATQAQNNFEQTLIVSNTLFSLTGSCISTFALSALLGKQLSMEDILNASLAGGVAIGAASGILYYTGVSLGIGILAGAISTLGFHYLTPLLERKIGLFDTCGIHNLHGIPGVLGGIISGCIVWAYSNGFNTQYTNLFDAKTSLYINVSSFTRQGFLQLGGTFVSLGFGLTFGIITGYILSLAYKQNPSQFYLDKAYFNTEEESEKTLYGINESNEQVKQRLLS